jgi:hypothetical protein
MHTMTDAPLQTGLLTPELQWQSRGEIERRIYKEADGAIGEAWVWLGDVCEGEPLPLQHWPFTPELQWSSPHSHPFETACLPLGYSGNPGVNGVSDREGCRP